MTGSAPLYATYPMVTCDPLTVMVAFQACWMVRPLGVLNATFQPVVAEVPVFVTVICPWNPPGQEFVVWYDAEQVFPAGGVLVDGDGLLRVGDTLGLGDADGLREGAGELGEALGPVLGLALGPGDELSVVYVVCVYAWLHCDAQDEGSVKWYTRPPLISVSEASRTRIWKSFAPLDVPPMMYACPMSPSIWACCHTPFTRYSTLWMPLAR